MYTLPARGSVMTPNTCRLKGKGWEGIHHGNGNGKKAKVPILMSEKIGFKTKTVMRQSRALYN